MRNLLKNSISLSASLFKLLIIIFLQQKSKTTSFSPKVYVSSNLAQKKCHHLQLQLYSLNPKRNNNDNIPSGAAETAAGAIFGGILGGPFGALFGAQIGASFGAKRTQNAIQQKQMEQLGITPEMLTMAEEAGFALNRGIEGLEATKDSLATQQKFAKRLDEECTRLYDEAKDCLVNGNEDEARDLLIKRDTTMNKLKKALKGCAEEKGRLDKMEQNVLALEERVMEIDALLKRTVGAKSLMDTSLSTSNSDFMRLDDEDPLLKKFKDLEKM